MDTAVLGQFCDEKDDGDDAMVVPRLRRTLQSRCEEVDVTSGTNKADFTLQRGTPQFWGRSPGWFFNCDELYSSEARGGGRHFGD